MRVADYLSGSARQPDPKGMRERALYPRATIAAHSSPLAVAQPKSTIEYKPVPR
jgi:hypothetical protein